MLQTIKFIVLLALTGIAFAGCDFKDPIDENIEGFWQLEYFETSADGARHDCERMYFGITRYVVEVAEKYGQHNYGSFIGRFTYKDGRTKVAMEDFKHRGNTSDNHVDATVEELLPFGMDATSTTFTVVSATGKRLILKSDYATLYLSKF